MVSCRFQKLLAMIKGQAMFKMVFHCFFLDGLFIICISHDKFAAASLGIYMGAYFDSLSNRAPYIDHKATPARPLAFRSAAFKMA